MEFVKEYQEHDKIFSCLNKQRTIKIYKLSIEEMMKRYFTRHEYMWFVRKSEDNFIFYFEPYYKRVGTQGYEVIHCAGGKTFCLPTHSEGSLKEVKYNGAKQRKYLPLSFEYLQLDEDNNFVAYGLIEQ